MCVCVCEEERRQTEQEYRNAVQPAPLPPVTYQHPHISCSTTPHITWTFFQFDEKPLQNTTEGHEKHLLL